MKPFVSQKNEKPWIRKSLKEKREETINRSRPPAAACLVCSAKLMPADLRKHRTRCPGRGEPHPLDTWTSESDVKARDLPPELMCRLVSSGVIRTRETTLGVSEYLLRDIEQWVTARELFGDYE